MKYGRNHLLIDLSLLAVLLALGTVAARGDMDEHFNPATLRTFTSGGGEGDGGGTDDILFYENCDNVTTGSSPEKGVGTFTIGASWTLTSGVVGSGAWKINNAGNSGGRVNITTGSLVLGGYNVDMARGRVGFYICPLESGAGADGDPIYGNGATSNPKWYWQNSAGNNSWSYKDKGSGNFGGLSVGTTSFIELAWDSAETILGRPCEVFIDGVSVAQCTTGSTGADPAPSSIRLGGVDGNGYDVNYDQIIISSSCLRSLYALRNTTSF